MHSRKAAPCPSQPVEAALRACAEGRIGANLLLMHLFLWAETPSLGRAVLDGALSTPSPAEERCNLAAALALWEATPEAFDTVKAVQAAEQTGRRETGWAGAFDRAASLSPEASVALYSLGRADILDAATAEVTRLLRTWNLLALDRHVLEIGCGIGRFLRALAGEVADVFGIDISAGMVEEARRRCADLGNVLVLQGDGKRFSRFADAEFDLVLAVDSFPYIVEAGPDPARRQVAEAARVLAPGGSLVIFNYSYRGDDARDQAELNALGRENGLALIAAGERPLRLWDGVVYRLRRDGGQERSSNGGR